MALTAAVLRNVAALACIGLVACTLPQAIRHPSSPAGVVGTPGGLGPSGVRVPGEILGRNNSLVVTNLEEDDSTLCPNFVMVDYAELEYRVRP